MRRRLHGGHHAGRVVEVPDPAPPYLQVPYRVPCTDPECAHHRLCGTCGIDTYELVVLIPPDHGPHVREYLCQPWK